ncbi:16391_t:CDS:2 [Acaulospora colombiana]|uniref:16391_t:CDS:1 n=1 Tax=Acaulospora colombiana TaxID=27376 RepID=A0ACA9LEQ3_9GLOM|nr:16391_t:CDS:2 [Acaulospora colombiana]
MASTMRAIRISSTGGSKVLKYDTVPRPEITGPDDVLVKNDFIGVNFIDVYHRTGLYEIPLPAIIGREGAGVVESVGENVKDVVPGDRVVYFGNSYAEYSNSPSKHVAKIPEGVDSEVAAASLIQGLTAHTLVTQAYPVKKDDWILIHAAAGGVGLLLTQLVKNIGAHAIGTVSTSEKAKLAKSAGAEYIINYTTQDVVKEVMQITNKEGVHAVYDGVGKSTFEISLECVRRLGTFVTFGNSSGKVPPFDVTTLAKKNIRLLRPTLFNYVVTKEEFQTYTSELFELLLNGKLNIKIWKRYKLSEVKQAHEDLEGRKTSGNTNNNILQIFKSPLPLALKLNMDEIFTKLALHTATLVGKAAFAYSTNYAMKQVTNYIKQDTTNAPHIDVSEIERVKESLELSIQMVQPAIDLIEIISARGNTTLEPTVAHTTMLRKEIESFARMISRSSLDAEESNIKTSKKKRPLDHSKIIKEMQDLILKIERFVPYLNLVMTTSGANLGWSLPNSVSPSRLLQASNALYEANRKFTGNVAKQMRVGPVYKLKLYYMFTASVRPKSVVDFTWKEEFTKCDAFIHRVREASKEFAYELVLVEDLNDGRYHEEFDTGDPARLKEIRAKLDKSNQSIPGKIRRIPVGEISRLYYTSSGSLLNIEESKTPVLVLKVIKGLSKAHLLKERSLDRVDLDANPLYVPQMAAAHDEHLKDAKEHTDVDLFALEIFQEAETFAADEEEDYDEEEIVSSDEEIDDGGRVTGTPPRENVRTPSPRKPPLPDTPSPKSIPLPETPLSRTIPRTVSSLPGTPSPRNTSAPTSLIPSNVPLPISDDEDSDATLSDDDDDEINKTDELEISDEHRDPVINIEADVESANDIPGTREPTDVIEVPDADLSVDGVNELDGGNVEVYQSNLKTLSLLEYILRLSALEVCEQTNHLELADEKINLFLKDDDPSGGSTGSTTTTESSPPRPTPHTATSTSSTAKPLSSSRRLLFEEELNAMKIK